MTPITRSQLLKLTQRELFQALRNGQPVLPDLLDGWAYRGTNLAPPVLRAVTWSRFQKTFVRDLPTGRLLGWNVRVEQTDGPSTPIIREGKPLCVWHYELLQPRGNAAWRGFPHAMAIDYSRGTNPWWDPIRFAQDPLVALTANNDVLLGVTYFGRGVVRCATPTFFALEREHRVEYVPQFCEPGQPRRRVLSPRRLSAGTVTRARRLMLAMFPGTEVPADPEDIFWQTLAETSASTFAPGLAAAVFALDMLPLVDARYRSRFSSLSALDQTTLCNEWLNSRHYAIRQFAAIVKVLVAFAHFDHPHVAARRGDV